MGPWRDGVDVARIPDSGGGVGDRAGSFFKRATFMWADDYNFVIFQWMSHFLEFLTSCWATLCELAPWLLLGMLLAGAQSVLLPTGFVQRRFQGLGGIVKAVAVGVPLPLCSCGVLPAGIGLKNQGASDGASIGFLISTPQTGVDSILVSQSFFGWPFAFFKVVLAAITGIAGGWLADTPKAVDPLQVIQGGASAHAHPSRFRNPLLRCFAHGMDTFASIWRWVFIGIVVSVLIDQLVPPGWLTAAGEFGLFTSMGITLLLAVPLYVCATASVPIAASLVRGGLPPAAALVFLMAGPATNVTTIGAIYQHFGRRALAAYLSSILIGSMAGAWVFDRFFTSHVTSVLRAEEHCPVGWIATGSGVIVLVLTTCLLIRPFFRDP